MSQDSQPLVTRNFLIHLAKGGVKSIPVAGGLLEEAIFGTLAGEEAQKEAEKLHTALSQLQTQETAQSTDLGDILRRLEQQATFTAEIKASIDALANTLDALLRGEENAVTALPAPVHQVAVRLAQFHPNTDSLIAAPPTTALPAVAAPAVSGGCVQALAQLTPGKLLARIERDLNRSDVASVWFKIFERSMGDDLPNQGLSECVIELIDRSRRRGKRDVLLALLCDNFPNLANP